VTDDPVDIVLGAAKSQYSELVTEQVVRALADHADRQPDSFDLQTSEPLERLAVFDEILSGDG